MTWSPPGPASRTRDGGAFARRSVARPVVLALVAGVAFSCASAPSQEPHPAASTGSIAGPALAPATASPAAPTAVEASPSPRASALGLRPLTPTATIDVGLPMSTIVATDTAIWAGDQGLARIDPGSNTLGATTGTVADAATSAFGSVWAADFEGSAVRRLDPSSGRTLATIPVVNPSGLVAAAGRLWVTAHRSGSVEVIDPRSNRVVHTVPVGSTGPSGPLSVALVAGTVWVGVPRDGTLVGIDPKTGKVETTIRNVTTPCGGIASSADTLWVTQCMEARSVDIVDLATDTSRQAFAGGYAGTPIPAGDAVWLPVTQLTTGAARDALVVKLDPAGERVDAVDLGPACQPAQDLVTGVQAFGSVWLACPTGRVLRLAAADLP